MSSQSSQNSYLSQGSQGNQNIQDSQNSSSEDEEQVTLAKIFMLNTKDRTAPRLEWHGNDPGDNYALFVYANVSDSTYRSYTHYDSIKQKRNRELNKSYMAWGPYYETYECMRSQPFQASLPQYTSLLYNKGAHTQKPHLATLLPSLMRGEMSYENDIDPSTRCKIYMFYPPSTQGLTMSGHPTVEDIRHTFWYKLDDIYNGDKEFDRDNIRPDSIITIGKREFDENYQPYSRFIPPNFPLHIFGREAANFKFLKARRSGTTKKLAGGKNNRKVIKKKINKRKKTRKIKQIRRRK